MSSNNRHKPGTLLECCCLGRRLWRTPYSTAALEDGGRIIELGSLVMVLGINGDIGCDLKVLTNEGLVGWVNFYDEDWKVVP